MTSILRGEVKKSTGFAGFKHMNLGQKIPTFCGRHMCIAPEHGAELIRDAAKELLDARRVADKSGRGF